MKKEKNYNALNPDLNKLEAVNEEYKLIVDEYFNNGFNVVKAVQVVRPELSAPAARVLYTTIKKKHSEYIQAKQQELKAETGLKVEHIVKELINHAFADVTDYSGMNPEDIKELPAEQRRAIQHIKHTKKSYTDRTGKEITEENTEIKLINKLQAFDMLAKYVGLYDADNQQKAPKIDIKSLNIEQLQVLNQVLNSAKVE